MAERQSWEFQEGDELQPGRVVLKEIGGGNLYEVCLVAALPSRTSITRRGPDRESEVAMMSQFLPHSGRNCDIAERARDLRVRVVVRRR